MKYFNFRKVVNIIFTKDLNKSIETINNKSDLRKCILEFRNTLDKNYLDLLSDEIYKNLFSIDIFNNSSKFMLYSSFRNEVNTKKIIKKLLENNKEVYLPITIKEDKNIIPKRIFSLKDLKLGAYGILEPSIDSPSINPSLLDIVIVPGSVFDISGYRTGYGGGYYDKFLEKTDATRIGLSFSFQIVKSVFPEKHDKRMDFIVTEKNILKQKSHLY